MSELDRFHDEFAIFRNSPDHVRTGQLTPHAQLWVAERTRQYGAVAVDKLTVADHCSFALVRWLVDMPQGRAEDYWWQARHSDGYTLTAENDVNRGCAYELAAIKETDLAWDILRLVTRTFRDEPFDRQAYTAFTATWVAANEENSQLMQRFSDEADQLWNHAIEIGETPIDTDNMRQNKILIASFSAPQEGFTQNSRTVLRSIIPPREISLTQSTPEVRIMPDIATGSAREGFI